MSHARCVRSSARVAGWPALAVAHEAKHEQDDERLPTIGAAADFALISQDSAEVTLAALRGNVVALTFIYASCSDVCPMLTDQLARVQDALESDAGSKIAFVSITTDPERDTPEVLKRYAEAFEANLAGWSFLTGERAAVLDVAHRYGVAVAKSADGQVDHNMLTMLIDRQGTMRVQYRLSVRSGGVPPRPPEPHERALTCHQLVGLWLGPA